MIGGSELLWDPEKPIYRGVAHLLVCDSVQLLNIAGIGLAGAAQAPLTSPAAWRLTGFLFLWMWHETWFLFSLVALNRYAAVCRHGEWSWVRESRRLGLLLAASWPSSFLLCFGTQTLLPCCPFVVVPSQFSIGWHNPGENGMLWTDYLVEYPGNTGTTVVILLCYGAIIRNLRRSNTLVQTYTSSIQATQIYARRNERWLIQWESQLWRNGSRWSIV